MRLKIHNESEQISRTDTKDYYISGRASSRDYLIKKPD